MEATSVTSREIVPEVLTKDNYKTWRALTKNYLVGQGLWGAVESSPEADQTKASRRTNNAKALHIFQLSSARKILDGFYHSETPKEARKNMSAQYNSEFKVTPDIEQGLGGFVQSFSYSEQEDEKEASQLKDAKALHIIQISCGRDILHEISSFTTAKEAWNHLSSAYGSDLKATPDNVQGVVDDSLSHCKRLYRLYRQVERGDSNIRESLLNTGDLEEAISSATAEGRTLLHVAVIAGHVENVKYLVEKGEDTLLEKKDKRGYTALALVAHYTGNTEIAKCLVEKKEGVHDKLLTMNVMVNDQNEIPVLLAAANGHKEMTRYLFTKTPKEAMDSDPQIRSLLLERCITAEIFDVALKLLRRDPKLLTEKKSLRDTRSVLRALATKPSVFPSGCRFGILRRFVYDILNVKRERTCWILDFANIEQFLANFAAERPQKTSFAGVLVREIAYVLVHICKYLNVFGIRKIYAEKYTHYEVEEILRRLQTRVGKFKDAELKEVSAYEAMLYAAKHGVIEFVNAMKKANPDLLWAVDNSKRGIFAHAILNRQQNVFQLIHGLNGRREILRYSRDVFGNNMLHLAGHLGSSYDIDSRSGAALQMQREIQWFKAVEEVVHPKCKEEQNHDGKKPREVFTENHKEQVKEGEKWAKDNASSFTLVAVLITTIMFAAAFTLPGGSNQDTGVPIFLHNNLFTVFLFTDALSLFTSVTSVLIFIGILTSRYAEKDFLESLPWKLLWGLIFLCVSVMSMIVAFCAALVIILKGYDAYWRLGLGIILTAGSIPLVVLVISQLRIMSEILKHTKSNSISYIKKQQ